MTARSTLNTAVLAPMPSARVRTTARAKPGDLARERRASRMGSPEADTNLLPETTLPISRTGAGKIDNLPLPACDPLQPFPHAKRDLGAVGRHVPGGVGADLHRLLLSKDAGHQDTVLAQVTGDLGDRLAQR